MSRSLRSLTLLLALLGVSAAAVLGCESVESAVPPTGTDAAARDAQAPGADAATETDASASADADASAIDASEAARDAGEPDCYAQPQTSAQLLNQCTTRGCVPFDNRGRLPLLYADGGVPALP
jgi:hypothetical protein